MFGWFFQRDKRYDSQLQQQLLAAVLLLLWLLHAATASRGSSGVLLSLQVDVLCSYDKQIQWLTSLGRSSTR